MSDTNINPNSAIPKLQKPKSNVLGLNLGFSAGIENSGISEAGLNISYRFKVFEKKSFVLNIGPYMQNAYIWKSADNDKESSTKTLDGYRNFTAIEVETEFIEISRHLRSFALYAQVGNTLDYMKTENSKKLTPFRETFALGFRLYTFKNFLVLGLGARNAGHNFSDTLYNMQFGLFF